MSDVLLYLAAAALGVLFVIAVLAIREPKSPGVEPVSRRALRKLDARMAAERAEHPGRQS